MRAKSQTARVRDSHVLSRRQFLATSSAALLAGALEGAPSAPAGATASESKLAMNGGPKAVPQAIAKLVRWGDPEKERLIAMIGQDSLFYWKGPQTAALI